MRLIFIVTLLMIVWFIIGVAWIDECDFRECIAYLSIGITTICAIVLCFMITFAICNNIGSEGKLAEYRQTYDSLVYQLKNELYDNDNDLGKKELMDQVTQWNSDLARNKILQNDPWIGAFYPNIYDGLEFIELD